MNVDGPPVLLAGCGILLDGTDIMQVDSKPRGEFRGLNAAAVSQLVPESSHLGRLALCFLSCSLCSFVPSLAHTLASGC